LRCNALRGLAFGAGVVTCVVISLSSAALGWQLPSVAGSLAESSLGRRPTAVAVG
jgi:hypothetical protein